MRKQNPFLLANNFSPKYFISRQSETERIIGAVTNSRNIVLVSRKGLGKTSLIYNVFNELKDLDSYKSIYLDLSQINNMSDFVNILTNSLIENDFISIKSKKKVKSILNGIIIDKHVDILTNHRSFSVNIEGEQEIYNSLEQVLNFLNSYNKKIVIAFGEFESIIDCCKKHLTTFLLKLIDNSDNISFIFSGNNKEKMLPLLTERDNQPIDEIEILQIDLLEKKKYQKFITKRFLKNETMINDESVEFILEWSRLNTYSVHQICNLIYERNPKKVKLSLVKEVINNILINKSSHYLSYKKLLSQYQWKLLKSIAIEGEAKSITSRNYMQKYKLNAPSSVKTAIIALIDKGLVYRKKQTYQICDVFFERWLAK
ncbi:MAG: ATP-binding protein [Arcobacter sp.]|nr:ATP-binding protein [Arcobacter sp.]